jgi:DNA (cytosine-5)-methyltransferase 1
MWMSGALPMSNQPTLWDMPNATSSQVEDSGALRSGKQDGQTTAPSGPDQRDGIGPNGAHDSRVPGRPGPLNGYWAGADWIGCRDGKFRPVEPGTFPLASGYSGRVGLLRLAGDAICVPAAQAFIESYLETEK